MLTQGIINWLEAQGVIINTNSRVISAVQKNNGEVTGVVIDQHGDIVRAKAKRGVIFATGGFAHSSKVIGLQRGPLFGTGSVPTARGDFLDIALSAGADVDNLANAFYFQCAIERAAADAGMVGLDGICWQVYGDSSILVNKYGKRCQNREASVSHSWTNPFPGAGHGRTQPGAIHDLG